MMRYYTPDVEPRPYAYLSLWEKAFVLAMSDDREDVPFAEKVSNALTFLKGRIH